MNKINIGIDPNSAADAAIPERRTRPVSNASYLAAANLGSKLFSFVFVLYATRVLGARLFGNYTAILAFVGLFGVLTDLGMSTLVVRDVSQDRRQAVRYVSNILVLRVLLAGAAIVLIVALAQTFVAQSLRTSVYVYAIALVPLAVSNTLQLVFQFSECMAYGAIINLVTAAVTAGLSMLALHAGHHVLALVGVFTTVTMVSTVAMALLVYTRFLPLKVEIDLRWWPRLVRLALPFVWLTVLNILYYRADTQILYVMSGCGHTAGNAGCTPVGYYGLANRLPDILVTIFVGSINAATLPAFNRVVAESHDALKRLVDSSITLMLVFGVPVAIFGSFFAPEALHVLGGPSYMVAAPALAILMWTFPFFLVEGVFFNALYALHRQSVVTMAFAVTLVFNVTFNILLIPHFSYMASSALTVASEAVNLVIVFVALHLSTGPLRIGRATLKVGLIAFATTAVLLALHHFSIFVALPAGTVVSLLGLRLSRVLGATERDILGRLPLLGRFAVLV